MEKTFSYKNLLVELEYRYPSENTSPRAAIRAREKRLRIYALSALGNTLAERNGWSLKGIDAIDFAIISKFSWFLPQVRDLSPANKWLALHEDLQSLDIDPAAIEAWGAKYENQTGIDLLNWTASPLGLPPDDTLDQEQS